MKTSITKIMLATSFMAFGVLTANAGEKFELSGEIRTRGEFSGKDFNSDTDGETFGLLRTRLNAKFSPLSHVNVVLTLQDSRVEGSEKNTLSNSKNLDLHQGYFDWSTINGSNFGLKVGRMELAYANQRLIGSVGWSNVGRSFDAAVFNYKGESFKADFFSSRVVEKNTSGQSDNFVASAGDLKTANRDFGDTDLIGIHSEFISSDGMSVQPFVYFRTTKIDDGSTATEDKSSTDNLTTLGLYYNFKMENGLSLEADGAYQIGKNDVTDVDTKAFMFGINASMWFGDSDQKFAVKTGFDMLSGDDGTDASENNTFNTLYATNHKFYGSMDYFLVNPTIGLKDIFVGGAWKKENLGLTADFHIFKTAEGDNDLGKELDLNLWWKINSAIKFNAGLGVYFPEAGDNGVWSYSGMTVSF
ncbi:MAG: hypothetical protein DWQ06_05690 [Calditrichaeota bacterium]|nr:MAG: hypothetical protein DWQ06_05690 [Calditrichota bacterium]